MHILIKTFKQYLWKRKVLDAICIRETKEKGKLIYGLSVYQVWAPLLSYPYHITQSPPPSPSLYQSFKSC